MRSVRAAAAIFRSWVGSCQDKRLPNWALTPSYQSWPTVGRGRAGHGRARRGSEMRGLPPGEAALRERKRLESLPDAHGAFYVPRGCRAIGAYPGCGNTRPTSSQQHCRLRVTHGPPAASRFLPWVRCAYHRRVHACRAECSGTVEARTSTITDGQAVTCQFTLVVPAKGV
jgi:hypothetical protein